MNAIAISLILILPTAADEKVRPKVPIGKETTYVDGPIDKDGYIDYEAALNARLSKNVTPQTNSFVVFLKAMGPLPAGKELPPELCKALGIGDLPAKGDYFFGLGTHVKDNLNMPQNEIDAVFKQQSNAKKHPWSLEDYPHVGAWLITNEKALDIVVEATKRPHFYYPVIVPRNDDGTRGLLLAGSWPTVQLLRTFGDALAARAFLRLGDGKDDAAWQDLLAVHRLAAHASNGPDCVCAMMGFGIEAVACQSDLAYLQYAKLTTKQLQRRLRELQALPPIAPIVDKMDGSERFVFLDSLQSICRAGLAPAAAGAAGTEDLDPKIAAQIREKLEKMDWGPVFRRGNQRYDRIVASLKIKDRAERQRAFDRMDEESKPVKNDAPEERKWLEKLAKPGPETEKAITKAIGDAVMRSLMPDLRKINGAWERSQQIRDNVQIAFALAAYRLDNKRYPLKLDDLSPTYLAKVPLDLFTGKPLAYRAADNSYLFYSFGLNGKDDDGRSVTDEPKGDDLGVRMPLP